MKGKTKILIGVAIGSMLGILFAPAKGKKTRKKIARVSKRLKARFNNKKKKCKEESFAQPIQVVEENDIGTSPV